MTAKELGNMAVCPIWEDDRMIDGITLRQQFAMAAMEAILSSNAPMPRETSAEDVDAVVAREAVRSADALLEELAKGTT